VPVVILRAPVESVIVPPCTSKVPANAMVVNAVFWEQIKVSGEAPIHHSLVGVYAQ
jgi:hypothetical protein